MNTNHEETIDVVETVASLQRELDRRRRELDESRKRTKELEQAEALLAGENRLLEMVAKGEPVNAILDGICRLVEEISSGSLCSILLLDPNGGRLRHGAAPSLPAGYIGAFGGKEIGPRTGPCGRAAWFKKPVIVRDIAADPLGDDYRELALAHGLRACWSTPILASDGRALGSFAVLSREPCSPAPEHQRIIAQMTHLAAVALERQRIETALRVSEDRFRHMADSIPEVMWFTALDPERMLYVSSSFERIWGLKVEDLYANPRLWTETIHPEDRTRVSATFSQWIAGGKVSYHDMEYRIVRADGGIRWIHERGVLGLDEKGKPTLASGISTDITERKRAEALLAGEKLILEMIAGGDALPPILDALCHLGEELTGGALVSILMVSADGESLHHGAAPSLPAEYIRAIDGGRIGPRAGSCGTAAYRKEPVVVSDIGNDPLWADYRQLALSAGLQACWSTPIFSTAHEVLGTFAVYRREPASPVPEQWSVVEQFAHLASIAIERTRAQEALRRSEAYLAEAQRLSLTGSFGWSIATGELVWSHGTFCIMGYDPAVKPALELVLKRVHPEDLSLVQQTIDHAMRDGAAFDFEHRLLMPDGSVKHLHVMAHPAKTEPGKVEFVGAVMDVTEQKQSQEATRAARARFEGILEIADDAIISVDSGQRIVLFNQGAEKVFGYDQSEVIGEPLDLLLPQRFAQAHQRHLGAFARSPEVSRTMAQRREVFGRRKDGSEFPAEASISKLDLGDEQIFTVILRDVTERKRAAEALHASEHVARGQLDALTHTLDALAQESEPDRLLEHVLRTIVEQTKAHSVAAWNSNEDGAWFDLIAVIENGRFQTREQASHPAGRISILPQNHPVWSEVLRTKQCGVLEDLDRDAARMCVGSGTDAVWHRVMKDACPDPAMTLLMNHLREMGVRAVLFVPMLIAGKVAGIIAVRLQEKRNFRQEEIELTRALAHQAMLAVQLMRLSQQSRDAAVVAERNRVARDIHDTLAQGFTGVIMQLEAAKGATSQGDLAEAANRIERAGELARSSLGEARRSVRALRPRSLRNGKLFLAIDDLFKRMTEGTSLSADFQAEGDERSIPVDCEEDLLRITQEALTNAVKHANARNFRATLSVDADRIQLRLVDDGRGFDPRMEHEGFGLIGMKERVGRMGGEFLIRAKPDVGTEILVELKNQPAKAED